MKKRLFTLALALILALGLMPGALAAPTPAASFNDNAQTYHAGEWVYDAVRGYYTIYRWASPVYSYLFADGDG